MDANRPWFQTAFSPNGHALIVQFFSLSHEDFTLQQRKIESRWENMEPE